MYLGLPKKCAAVSPYTGQPVIVYLGENNFFGAHPRMVVDGTNEAWGVTPQQAAAMQAGVLYGWDDPRANPAVYNEQGQFLAELLPQNKEDVV